MATQYEIDIMMSADTVAQLKDNGFFLYAFKAVKTSNTGAAPTVWFKTQEFLQTTQVIWTEQYQAYISESQIIPNGVIKANTAIDIDLDQTANADANGNLTVAEQGTPSAISINNLSSAPWTAGISEVVSGTANPMCALPLFGNMLDVIAPIEKVLVMFATNTVDTGTVIYQSYSSGVLVDLTAAQQRSVNFDINAGWNWGGAAWGTAVPAQESLVPILISGGSALSMRAPRLAGRRQSLTAGADAAAVRNHVVRLNPGATHTFAANTWPDGVEIDNLHNVDGNVRYRLGLGAPPVWQPWVVVPLVRNGESPVIPYNNPAQVLQVENTLPQNSIQCLY